MPIIVSKEDRKSEAGLKTGGPQTAFCGPQHQHQHRYQHQQSNATSLPPHT